MTQKIAIDAATARFRHEQRGDGFTLIEMLVVMAVLTLVTLLVPAYLTAGRARAELKAAARAIASSLRETREEALARNRSEAFVIDLVRSSYHGTDARSDGRLPAGTETALVTTAEQAGDAGHGSIRFFPDGSSTGGGVILTRGEVRYEVLVDWLTGRVSLAEDRIAARR